MASHAPTLAIWFCCIDAFAVFEASEDTEVNLGCFIGLHGCLHNICFTIYPIFIYLKKKKISVCRNYVNSLKVILEPVKVVIQGRF